MSTMSSKYEEGGLLALWKLTVALTRLISDSIKTKTHIYAAFGRVGVLFCV